MSRVFISYSRKDSEFALKLAHDLRAQKIEIWIDQIDIPAGKPWDDEIEKALDSSTHFLLILSKASVESPNVKDELAVALDEGKIIVPVLIEDCRLPLRIRRFQHIDAKSDYTTVLKKLTETLRNSKKTDLIPITPSVDLEPKEGIPKQIVFFEDLPTKNKVVEINLSSYITLGSILDELWFQMQDIYHPFTYGTSWLLVSQNLPIPRVIGTWDWFIRIPNVQSMHTLDEDWDIVVPEKFGMKSGTKWRVVDIESTRAWECIYAIVSNDEALIAYILAGARGAIESLLASNQLQKVTQANSDKSKYAYKCILYDETKRLGGQILKPF